MLKFAERGYLPDSVGPEVKTSVSMGNLRGEYGRSDPSMRPKSEEVNRSRVEEWQRRNEESIRRPEDDLRRPEDPYSKPGDKFRRTSDRDETYRRDDGFNRTGEDLRSPHDPRYGEAPHSQSGQYTVPKSQDRPPFEQNRGPKPAPPTKPKPSLAPKPKPAQTDIRRSQPNIYENKSQSLSSQPQRGGQNPQSPYRYVTFKTSS